VLISTKEKNGYTGRKKKRKLPNNLPPESYLLSSKNLGEEGETMKMLESR